MATAARHREISAIFLQQAEEEFEKGDLLQASEKGWGAVAHYGKAISEEQGWQHHSHYLLRRNMRRLLRLTDEVEGNLFTFGLVEQLHVNFYDDTLSVSEIRSALDDARTIIALFQSVEANLAAEDSP